VAAAQKGYIPVGIDIKMESCEAGLAVLQDMGLQGYTVMADLQAIPFQDNIFEQVWSFSVIQHTHRKRALNCLQEINRILQNNKSCKLEFPTKHGFWNKRVIANRPDKNEEDDFDSWCVRYYDLQELETWCQSIFGNFIFDTHCYFGIGILPLDLQYVKWYYKPAVATSLLLTATSKLITPLKYIADSVYVVARKQHAATKPNTDHVAEWKQSIKNKAWNNLDIVPLLCCPVSGSSLVHDKDQNRLVTTTGGLYYPVRNNIPVLLAGESKSL
jgi:uncharacterized protein YbaR (Trm112 family)/SAM-dependent methyltransferase